MSKNRNDGLSENDNNQLLRDIEAISNALHLNEPPLSSLSRSRSRSAEKSRFSRSRNELGKDRKSGSLWDWKKPLKALSHIGQHTFDCCFYLHAHSVEGLGSSFDGLSLCVNWKRKDENFRTRAVRVVDGIADFGGDSLMLRCCVYGSGNVKGVAKYGEKISLIYVDVVGVSDLDSGKHWVDLTRLLPLTMEELVGARSSGKWTTSMKLTGAAEGAVLNVSLSFSVLKDNSMVPGNNMSFSQLLKLTQDRDSSLQTGACLDSISLKGSLRRAGSIPSKMSPGSEHSAHSVDFKLSPEVLLSSRLELSRSIKYLYQKLDEQEESDLAKSEVFEGNVLPFQKEFNSECRSVNEENESEWDDIQFTVIEKGIELPDKEQLETEQKGGQIRDAFTDETFDRNKIDEDEHAEKTNSTTTNSMHAGSLANIVAKSKKGVDGVCMKRSGSETPEADLHHCRTVTTICGEYNASLSATEFSEQEVYLDDKANYKSHRMAKKSLSLDCVNKAVEDNFSFLGTENASPTLSFNSDTQSPCEKLLIEFENEILASGNFIFDFDANSKEEESGSSALTSSDSTEISDPFDFLLAFPDADKHEKNMQSLRERRKAAFLDDLETEDLMKKWGLNEKVFCSSLYDSCGFGSPIELPPESPLKLPPLGEGLCPYVRTKHGGQLCSMNPRIFRNAKNGTRLVMQVSRPVVLPAELGSGIFDILQSLASIGVDSLSLQMEKLMPLDDITGRRLQQIQDAETGTFMPKQQARVPHESVGRDLCQERDTIEEFLFRQSNEILRTGSTDIDLGLEYVLLEDLAPLAIEKIEPLSIEGLRIQSGMSNKDVSSSLSPQSSQMASTFHGLPLFTIRESDEDIIELLDLSLTLDEWLRLDTGNIGDRDRLTEHGTKMLTAHHAMCFANHGEGQTEGKNLDNGFDKKHGLLSNCLMIVLRLQLRDPFRNFEPVGTPMLSFLHVERVAISMLPKIYSLAAELSHKDENSEVVVKEKQVKKNKMENGYSISKFKINELHLAGLQSQSSNQQHWGTATSQRSGVHWLLASGLGKTTNYPLSKSKAIIRASRQVASRLQPEDTLWSISSHIKESSKLASHIRNPDIIFQNGRTKSHTARKY